MPRIDRGVVGHIIAWAFYGFLAFLIVILWSQEGHCAEKPKVQLTASPRMALAPAVIRLRLVIQNGGERLWCPTVVWYTEETRASRSSDCEPFDKAEPKAIARQSWTRSYVVGQGSHEFCVGLEKPEGKTITRLCTTVEVR